MCAVGDFGPPFLLRAAKYPITFLSATCNQLISRRLDFAGSKDHGVLDELR